MGKNIIKMVFEQILKQMEKETRTHNQKLTWVLLYQKFQSSINRSNIQYCATKVYWVGGEKRKKKCRELKLDC